MGTGTGQGGGGAHFDQFASDYQRILTEQLKGSGLDADFFAAQKARIIAEESAPAGGGAYRLLDVGCGNGLLDSLILGEWARRGTPPGEGRMELDGIDVSAKSVEESAARGLPAARFRAFDGTELPFGDGTFDAVVFCVVMHHVPPAARGRLLAECARAMKPGGKLFVFEHNPANPLTRYVVGRCPFDADAVLLRSGEARRLLEGAGLRVEKRSFINFFPNRAGFRGLRRLERYLEGLPLGAQYYVRAAKPA